MSLCDPIADMLTCIRNAAAAGHKVVKVPHSLKKANIVNVLCQEGYLASCKDEGDGKDKVLSIGLKYHMGKPVILALKRVSRPGLRIYRKVGDLPRVMGGLGTVVVSTSQGVVSGREAKRRGVGGEVICLVE